jgi:putative restriction endonuclease
MESRASRGRRSRGASAGADEAILARFAAIRVWTRGGERAPHKSLLLLYALAALQRREPRLIPFARLEEAVGKLLRDFGPPRSTSPAYPFWHLQSDGVWEIPQREALQHDLDIAAWRHNPRVSVIREAAAQGGLDAQLFKQLRARPDLVDQVAAQLLKTSFPASIHEDILDAVGMPWVPVTPITSRDAAFRQTILRIYRHQCGVCGYDGQLGSTDLDIEAAHVMWHMAGGPDSEDNGVALCTLHHKAFDRGALGLDDDCRILVSEEVRGGQAVEEWLLRFAWAPLRPPLPGRPQPAERFVRWHRKEVFRAPARAV